MATGRVIRRAHVGGKSANEKTSSGKMKWVIMALVLLMAGAAYAFLPSRDPALARIESIRGEMDGADDAKRRELWGQMRQEFDNLTPESREKMREDWGARREAREDKRMSEFLALSPQEQIKELDEDIKRDAARRKEWEKRRSERGNGNGGGARGGPGGRGGRGRDTSGDPNARRKSYLNNTSPQSRAMRGEYRRMREERSRVLGL
jgi:hypothetical protein